MFFVTASAVPQLPFVSAAHAQCVRTGNNVTCSGNDLDGFELNVGGLDNFIVNGGAQLTALAPFPFGPVAVVFVDETVVGFRNEGTILPAAGSQAGIDVGAIGASGFFNSGSISGSGAAPAVFVRGEITGPFINTSTGLISGFRGLDATGSIASVENRGEILADDIGINSDDTIGTVINSGLISADVAVGAQIGIGSVVNTGLIEGGLGVTSNGTIGSVVNTGEIFGAGNAIEAPNITSLINSGLIDSIGDGIDVDGGSSDNDELNVVGLIVNTGTIRGDDDGVDVGTLTRLVNSGSIIGGFNGGTNSSGIAAAVITEIVNSGLIMTDGTTDSWAIEERGREEITVPVPRAAIDGGPTILTLNAGSILIGRVDLGGGTNTLNIGRGRSLNSTFEDPDGESVVPVIGSLAGHLFAFQDTTNGGATNRQMVAVDLSAFQGFEDALSVLTSGYGGVVQARQAGLRSGHANGFSAGDLEGAVTLADNHVWVEGFGAFRHDQSDRIGGDFDHLTGGLVAGMDRPLDDVTSIGAMAGFAVSTSENDINTQTNTATSFYAGLYGSTQAIGIAWDASLTVGYTDYEAERITANNLVAGGLETARADFGGWFINPQVTASREASNPLSGQTIHGFAAAQNLEQSLTFSYAGLFLDGYTETGTTNPLTLNDRSVHIASARAAIALPFERTEADGALTTLRLIGGLEARTQFGDDTVSGTLLGQAVRSTLDDDDFNAGAFLGLSGEYQATSGLTAYADIEAMLETDLSYQISASAGLRLAF